MDKLQKLELMDKVLRELEDLKNSQTSVLKKLAQIETDNIMLNAEVLSKSIPELHEEVDSSVTIVTELLENFKPYRDDFYTKNNMAAMVDPTA